ncbi:hypothetical protein Pcinc_015553 [Petrolisthes cinctipes]|uniref:Short coiled-coil protein n=1 Tax=Petrolisthes cinctipes TaxID=88211 RepID=A0AAE1KPL7_PETCI|nr:hypothetical protein Pcinc_015553 [Petrolisthes cinctipes]
MCSSWCSVGALSLGVALFRQLREGELQADKLTRSNAQCAKTVLVGAGGWAQGPLSFTLVQLLINYFTLASAHSGAVEARTSVMSSYQDDNSIPLVDDDPSVVVDDDRTAASEISADSTRGQSLESIPSAYTNGSNSPLHNSLEPDMSPDEQEEKARLIAQVLELQNTLDDLSQRVDSVKEENLKLRSENQVLGQYIENLMSASSVFQSTSPKTKKKGT